MHQNNQASNFRCLEIDWHQDSRHNSSICKIVQEFRWNDIQPPYIQSCQQRSKLISNDILKIVQRRIKKLKSDSECDDLGVRLMIVFQTNHKI